MVDDNSFRKIFSVVIIVSLLILSLLILRPIMISIIIALILVFIFAPIYDRIHKIIKSKNLSATIIILILLLLIILPIWFFTPILLKQSFDIFQMTLKFDFTKAIKSIFPALFASEQFSTEVGSIISSFTSGLANQMVNYLARIILNFPVIMLHIMVIFFTFFFVLRDKDLFIAYIKSLLPFTKEVEEKIFKYSSAITSSLIYGQVVIGIIQGIILGIGLFLFGIPNALFLMLLTAVAGIIPIVGPFLIWAPLATYILITDGPTLAFFGILIFGTIASSIDNYLRPMIVSKKVNINSGIILISMIGGLFFFGVVGLLLGPLIISYLLIFLEIYRGKTKSTLLITESSK